MDGCTTKISKRLHQMITAANSIAIVGHIHPDGDCVGSTLAMYNYISQNYKKNVAVYIEKFSSDFNILSGAKKVKHEMPAEGVDLAISIDVSTIERMGPFEELYKNAISTICIDHHVSNSGFGDLCYVSPDASSACEALCDLIDVEKIDEKIANCLFLGMVHDTGVFKYSNTSRKTMELAGYLIERGAKQDVIIDETFYKKTYKQNILMSRVVLGSELHLKGKVISGICSKELFKEYKCTSMDTEGIVEQLRLTDGVEVAIFAYQLAKNKYKFSLRSKSVVDVNVIASTFGGGGHVRAAGLETEEPVETVIQKIIEMVEEQLSSK